jgi:hypothetical protein
MPDLIRDLGSFYRDCWRESHSKAWIAVNGVFGGLVAVVITVLMPRKIFADHPNWDAIVTFIIYAAIAYVTFLVFMLLVVSPFLVWRRTADRESREKVAKETLEARLVPKLKARYNPNRAQCRSISEFRDQFGRQPHDGMCFRLEVTNEGPETVVGCKAQLIEIYFEGENSELGPMILTWAGALPQELISPSIVAQTSAYLDILVITESGQIKVGTLGWPLNRMNFFIRQGSYFLTVVISSDNSATLPPYRLKLNFDGNWKTSTLEPL